MTVMLAQRSQSHARKGFPQFPVCRREEAPVCVHARLRGLIEDIVSSVFAVEAGQLRRTTRGRANIALARQVAMYIAHVGYGLSLTEVGRLFERDRTTVAHACGVVEVRRDDPAFDEAVVLLELIVRAVNGSCVLVETGSASSAFDVANG